MTDLCSALAYLESGDWEAAHRIVQDDDSRLAAWAHGIVHMLEGDLANAAYWYRRADRPLPAEDAVPREIAELRATLVPGRS